MNISGSTFAAERNPIHHFEGVGHLVVQEMLMKLQESY